MKNICVNVNEYLDDSISHSLFDLKSERRKHSEIEKINYYIKSI